MMSPSESHIRMSRNAAVPLDSMEVAEDINPNEVAEHSKSKEMVDDSKKSSNIICLRRISTSSPSTSQAHRGYPSAPTPPSEDMIEDATDGSIVTSAANPSHDIRVLAQLYHSSRRSRNAVFVSGRSCYQPLSTSMISSSSSLGDQQIWDEMQDAIGSTEIDEWAFTIKPPICRSYSTNSLSSIESNEDMAVESVTAGELFNEDIFERL
jgi:hypothetical protein